MPPMPRVTRSWTISPNNRIVYVSLNDMTARYLFGVKQFLTAHGYTVAGSSNGTTAAMDGVDRWVTFTDASHRGAATNNAQSWIVLVDGNGVQILLAYTGGTDDLSLEAYSPGALYVVQGTATFKPTATDETVFTSLSSVSLLGSFTSGDRVWHGWVDASRKMCRFVAARQNAFVGYQWGVEVIRSSVRSPCVLSPAVWGFAIINTTNIGPSTSGAAYPKLGSVTPGNPQACQISAEELSGSYTTYGNLQTELNGGPSAGYCVFPLSITYADTKLRGKLGNIVDWWLGRTNNTVIDGDCYGDSRGGLSFLAFGDLTGTASSLWPWDGVTLPVAI